MINTAIKKSIKQSSRFQIFNIEVLDEKSQEFLVNLYSNDKITSELNKELDKFLNKHNIQSNSSNNIPNTPNYITENSESDQQDQQEVKEVKGQEEDNKGLIRENLALSSTSTLLMEIQGYSVFSDLRKDQDMPMQKFSVFNSRGSVSSNLLSSKINSVKRKKGRVNENANVGALPSSHPSSSCKSTDPSHSAWESVNTWLSKAFKKIQKYTTDFLSYLHRMCRSILIEFGILILGISLLYSAGFISNPSIFFKNIFDSLMKFLSSLF